MIKKIKSSSIKDYLIYIVSSLPIVIVFIWRLFHTIDKGDEVQNLTMAYRLVIGQRPWVDIWEIFQSGNSFASPAIWLLVKITGSTDGIILFVRLVFFLMNLILGLSYFLILRKYIYKSVLGGCILAIICYAPFSLYYIWYDTMGLYFMLLGALFLFAGLQNKRSFTWFVFFAGVSHALMSYAYPSFVLLTFIFASIFYYLNRKKKKSSINCFFLVCLYFIGAGIVFLIFLMYLIHVGIDNTIFVQRDVLKLLFSCHDGAQNAGLVRRIVRLFWCPLKKMVWFIVPTILMIIFYFKNMKKLIIEVSFLAHSQKKLLGLLLGIVLIPLILCLNLETWSTVYYTFYLFCWSPFLLLILKNLKIKSTLIELFWLMWIPCIGSYIIIGLTSNNGGYKSPLGTYSGWIFGILLIGILLRNILVGNNGSRNSYLTFNYLNVITVNIVVLFTLNTFWYGNVWENKYKFESGIFKGLYGQIEDANLEKQEVQLKSIINKEMKHLNLKDEKQGSFSILCVGVDLLSIYLYTDLKPATFFFSWVPYVNVDGEQDWSPTEKYWKNVSGYPDFLLISDNENIDKSILYISGLLDDTYDYCTHIENASVWVRK